MDDCLSSAKQQCDIITVSMQYDAQNRKFASISQQRAFKYLEIKSKTSKPNTHADIRKLTIILIHK